MHQVLLTLREAGHQAVLVGGCVRDQILGLDVKDWDVTTSATADELLDCFPRGIPIGGAHGTVMIPSRSTPIDVSPYRAADLAGDLARRDFTINAIAWDPQDDVWWDPTGGRDDLAARILRAPGDPRERLAEDPLRALRAARLAAAYELDADPALRQALTAIAGRPSKVASERVRAELDRLLETRSVGRGVALLRETGLEAEIIPGAAADLLGVLEHLPRERDLRLAAWLRGTNAAKLLARWRFPKHRARAVERVLAVHPVDTLFEGARGARALRRRTGGGVVLEHAVLLRLAELTAAGDSTAALDKLREELSRNAESALSVNDLALKGSQVIEILGIPPGPDVGRALRHLLEAVTADPALNEPERLTATLRAWHAGRRD